MYLSLSLSTCRKQILAHCLSDKFIRAPQAPAWEVQRTAGAVVCAIGILLAHEIIRAPQAPAWEVQRTAGAVVGAIGTSGHPRKLGFRSWDTELTLYFEPGSLSSEN